MDELYIHVLVIQPFLTSGFVHSIIWMSPFVVLSVSGEYFHF